MTTKILSNGLRALTNTAHDYKQGILGQGALTLDALGRQKVVQDLSVFSGVFIDSIPERQWLAHVGGVDTSLQDSKLITTSLDALNIVAGSDLVELSSKAHPQHQANRGLLYSALIGLPGFKSKTNVKFGLANIGEESVVIEKKANGTLYASVYVKGNAAISKKLLLPKGFNLIDGNVYSIQIMCQRAFYYVVDQATGLNTHVATLDLPDFCGTPKAVYFSCAAKGKLTCGCVDVSVEGGAAPVLVSTAGSVLSKACSGTDVPVISLRVPLTVSGKHNTRLVELRRVKVASTKRGMFKIWRTSSKNYLKGSAFVKGSNAVELDVIASSVDLTKCTLIDLCAVEPNGDGTLTFTPAEGLVKGDSLIVTYSGSASTVDAVITWGETP